jgi:hypothetical protein
MYNKTGRDGEKGHRTVELPLVMDTFASNKASTACSSDSEHLAMSTFSTPWSAHSESKENSLFFIDRKTITEI